MKADLSRGHRPDHKRGRSYRRVLLQQGRLLLDSDVAAMTDALDAELRGLCADVAGDAGSPDLGYLITPGLLLASFEELARVTPAAGNPALFRFHLDHGRRYLGRLPSLYLGAQLASGELTIALRHAVAEGDTLRVWARLPLGTVLRIIFGGSSGSTPAGTGSDAFDAYDVVVPAGVTACTSINVVISAASSDLTREAWLGLLERREAAGQAPAFRARAGRYHLGGLRVALGEDALFPGASFIPATGAGAVHGLQAQTASAGDLYLAYLEAWERTVTHVEDPGLLEQALGGSLDTCARGQIVGQVKLAACTGLTPAEVLGAFAVKAPQGTLEISAASQAATQDPCAIPEVEGYTGGDNRLYRFEVHTGGGLGACTIKWSRNNGAELYRVAEITTPGGVTAFKLAPGADLRDGDLVELLDDCVDLGDAAPATLDASGFTPSARAVGTLGHVSEIPGAPGQIKLVDAAGAAIPLSYASGTAHTPKLRRWHGLLRPTEGQPGPNDTLVHTVDGIKVSLGAPAGVTDPFRPGDYWQYEARRLFANDNGPWQASPHGPERVHAPLALLAFQGALAPLELLAWYGGRTSPLFALAADDVAYDGGKAGSGAGTVQEALDELFARHDDGCCYVDMEPVENPIDDAARILELIQTRLPTGGVICLRPGVYWLRSQLTIAGMSIELRGCPDAVLVSDASGLTPIVVGLNGKLTLSGLVYCTASATPGPALIELGDGASLEVRECGLFHVGPTAGVLNPGIAVMTTGAIPSVFNPASQPYEILYNETPGLPDPLPQTELLELPARVRLEGCVVIARWAVAAATLEALTVHGSVLQCKDGAVCVEQTLMHVDLSGSLLASDLPDWAFNDLRQLQPEAMEEAATNIVEHVAKSTSPQGTAFYVRDLFGGSVTGCGLFGHLGFCAGLARGLRLQGNHYGGTYGLRLDNVAETSILDEVMDLQLNGYAAHGILLARSAFKLIIAGCSVTCIDPVDFVGEGITFGFWEAVRFRRVLVSGNLLIAGSAGIMVYFSQTQEALADESECMQIVGNQVRASNVGICCGDVDGVAVSTPTRRVALVSNDIRAWSGTANNACGIIIQSAAGSLIKDNSIAAQTGIQLLSTNETTILNNDIRIQSGVLPDASTAWGSGIHAQYSSRCKIAGNVMTCTDPVLGTGLLISYCDEPTIEDNTLSAGENYVNFSTYVVLRGNRIQGNVVYSGVSDGTLLCNTVEDRGYGGSIYLDNAAPTPGPNLVLLSASGTWHVEGNRADKYIAILPAVSGGSEISYRATVSDNLAHTLIVGRNNIGSSTFVPPSSTSTVVITGNVTQQRVLANAYANLLLTNNTGKTVIRGTTDHSVAGPIIANNIKA